jgi:hypothetical protein
MLTHQHGGGGGAIFGLTSDLGGVVAIADLSVITAVAAAASVPDSSTRTTACKGSRRNIAQQQQQPLWAVGFSSKPALATSVVTQQ